MKELQHTPEVRRQTLILRLVSAQSDVAAARRSGDPGSEAAARARVHSAKVALGERGAGWWEAAA
jgi:uncharacterized protein